MPASAMAARTPGRHLVDLSQPAEMLEWERRSVGTADGERGYLRPLARGAFEHQPVRSHAAFGASRT
jgi:hypothetical protein